MLQERGNIGQNIDPCIKVYSIEKGACVCSKLIPVFFLSTPMFRYLSTETQLYYYAHRHVCVHLMHSNISIQKLYINEEYVMYNVYSVVKYKLWIKWFWKSSDNVYRGVVATSNSG